MDVRCDGCAMDVRWDGCSMGRMFDRMSVQWDIGCVCNGMDAM
jgi:hypothetical protein